jgi:adenine-specific DNA-methyltransferase
MIKLDQPYSPWLFQDILESLFGDKKKIFDTSKVVTPKWYWKYITRMDRIGEQSDLEVQFYVVEHRWLSDPRVSLTKEIFRTLSDAGHRRALVAIYHPDSSTWRLSLVTMTLDIDNHGKLTREYSNARRYSFLLWEDEKTRTPNFSLLKKWKVIDLSDLISRFSVEVVRQEFFDDYIDLFIRLYIAVSNDEKFSTVLWDAWVDRVKFTKNLLGKIVFIYFIQKKWWLGLSRDESWWRGDMNFMRSLWNRFHAWDTFVRPSTGNFYNDYLEHLFYNGFNKDRREDDAYDPITRMRIPYLNGGLFKEDYKSWADFDAKVSNDIFSNGKDGILDIFDLYNFTIDEDDLYDSEVAVDPEMLGKIFEKMISVSSGNIDEIITIYKSKWKIQIWNELNKKFWAFYTPREIVHYMTRESLIAYISNGLRWSRDENETKVRALIFAKDRHLSKSGDINNISELDMLISIAEEVDTLLQKVKILDPAVGSGAFPMGILHEISTLRYYLHSEGFCMTHHHEDEEQTEDLTSEGHISMYRIKRDTIKNSIYGVDIEPGAIDIARLRFWLSLVVDADKPEPLPNFEFKFVSANTLIPLEPEITKDQLSLDLGKNELNLRTLRRYMTDYYNTNSKIEKKKLEDKITSYVTFDGTDEAKQMSMADLSTPRRLQLSEFRPFDPNHSNPFFDPSLMMWEWRGFDIVIGNPPYIKEYDNKKAFDGIRSWAYYMGKMDIWYYFGCLWLDLLKEWGIECYIAQNNWITSFGAKILRNKILQDAKIKEFIDFWDFKVFQDVGIQTMIYILEKTKSNMKYQVKYSKLDNKDFNIRYINQFLFWDSNSSDYKKHRSSIDKLKYLNSTLDFADEINEKILEKIYNQWNFRLEEKEVAQWIVGAPDDYYLVTDTSIFTAEEKKMIKRFYTNTGKFYSWISTAFLIYIKDTDLKIKDLYPNIYNHFEPNINFLTQNRVNLWTPTKQYFNLHRERDELFFQMWAKIVCWTRVSEPSFYYTEEEYYGSRALNFIKTDRINLKYLTAILNSNLSFYWLKNKWKLLWSLLQVDKSHLLNIPIKNISSEDQQPFIKLVDDIISAKLINPLSDTRDLELQIDDLVYGLYGLLHEEINTMKGNF